MGWTAPVNEATGYVVTSTDWDNFLSGSAGNFAFLYGDSGWTAVPTFTNSWAASGTTPGYMLIGRVVYLRGAMTAGTANTAAFTLPVGYRPSLQCHFLVSEGSSASVQDVAISSAGVVTPFLSVTTYLSAISFPTV